MSGRKLAITLQKPKSERRKRTKGRQFEAHLLAFCDTLSFTEHGHRTGAVLPFWVCFAGGATELLPFIANFRGGLPAEIVGTTVSLQIPRERGYRWHQVTTRDLVTVTAYDPNLLHLDVHPQDDHVEFLVLPPRSWLDAARANAPLLEEDDILATLFCAHLDRRCRLPILAGDVRFHRRLYEAALEDGWLRRACHTYPAPLEQFDQLHIARPLACSISQKNLDEVLASAMAAWRTKGAH